MRISQRISWFFLVVPSSISCFIVMCCLLVSVRHVLVLSNKSECSSDDRIISVMGVWLILTIVSQAKKKLRFPYAG